MKEDITLEKGEDGVYIPKKQSSPKKSKVREPIVRKRLDEADEFLSGLDAGLEFLEKLSSKIQRMNQL